MANTLLSTDYFSRFQRSTGLTDKQHADALRPSPCVPYASGAVEYIYETHRLTVKPSMVRQAVRDGALPTYRIGREFHFAPKDLDDWLDSLRVSTS
ncbi:helix-turn-helix domain-containing protein [Rhodococcus globerulus]|uniref:helix-turn-helix domain-containing protein n=1 Tax=Rhodococcus globerulus TaxID=33008 RepID=UPI000AFD5320|nr:helix-turn-helix domain-containing protein [Rhodococcus globerulus]